MSSDDLVKIGDNGGNSKQQSGVTEINSLIETTIHAIALILDGQNQCVQTDMEMTNDSTKFEKGPELNSGMADESHGLLEPKASEVTHDVVMKDALGEKFVGKVGFRWKR